MADLREAPALTVVTGATGWLGRTLIAALLDDAGPWTRPGTIRALIGPSERADGLADHPRLERVAGDVRRPGGLRDLFAGLAATTDVIHAAGVIHPATTSDFVEVNARGTQNVATLARRAGVRRFVHVSSNSPFGVNAHPADRFRNEEPYHPYLGYGRSKMLAELRLLDEVAAGLDAVIVRPPWFYGPHQPARQTAFFKMVRTGRFPVFGDGRQRRSMVYVGNLVQGVVRAELTPTPPGRGWWIADADAPTINDIVATVRLVLREAGLDVAPHQLRLPAAVARAAERADRVVQRAGRYSAPLHVLGELGHTIACDITAARAELGYDPDVALPEGMRRSVEWCLAHGIAL